MTAGAACPGVAMMVVSVAEAAVTVRGLCLLHAHRENQKNKKYCKRQKNS
jgi:hypothetical protein